MNWFLETAGTLLIKCVGFQNKVMRNHPKWFLSFCSINSQCMCEMKIIIVWLLFSFFSLFQKKVCVKAVVAMDDFLMKNETKNNRHGWSGETFEIMLPMRDGGKITCICARIT